MTTVEQRLVFVTSVSVEPIPLPGWGGYAPGAWDAIGVMVQTGDTVRWAQVRQDEPAPTLGETITLPLEPASWKVAR